MTVDVSLLWFLIAAYFFGTGFGVLSARLVNRSWAAAIVVGAFVGPAIMIGAIKTLSQLFLKF